MTQLLETLEADPALGHVFQACWGAKMDVFGWFWGGFHWILVGGGWNMTFIFPYWEY